MSGMTDANGTAPFAGASVTGLMQQPPVAAAAQLASAPLMPRADSCRCDYHKYGRRPGTDAVLYAGPDAVMLTTHAAIRDGRYEDIGASFDRVQHGIHAAFDAAERRFARTLAPAWRAFLRADEARRGVAA